MSSLHGRAFVGNPFADSDSDSEGYAYDPEVTLESIQKSKTINFSIRANYTNWAPREAFRELVQNWRDGIIRSFQLAEKDFCVVRKEKTSNRGTEIVYSSFQVKANDEKECLGYIRFSTKGGNGSPGIVELTNRAATLQPRHLDLGGTTKANDVHQAGAHGEGLKLALLVLMRGRQNHSVRCRSGGFNWRFNFTTSGRLVCRLHRMSPQAMEKAVDQARRLSERTLLPFAVKPRGDVQFVIGETLKGRDERGNSVQRRGVTQQEFDDWIKCALFLCENVAGGAIISTEHGDLLTDERLRGNVYLKGLLLGESTPTRSASITNRPLQFGYNFTHGRTNRERQSLAGAHEESAAILSIWGSVLTSKPSMAASLSDMLNDTTTPTCADVFSADRDITAQTATILRDHLTTSHPQEWFFSAEAKAQNPRLDRIIAGLGYQPAQLTKPYWTLLRKYNLLRTAEEEEERRFTAAPLIADHLEANTFATSVQHLLRACGRACPQTRYTTFHFVQAGNLHLQLFYSEEKDLFLVHERWLSARSAVDELGLPEDLSETDVVFHAVKRLFSDALEQLDDENFETAAKEGEDLKQTGEWRRRLEVSMAEQRLMSCLRMAGWASALRVVADEEGLRVTVGWWPDGVDSGGGSDADGVREVEVQCHEARRCGRLRGGLLVAEDAHIDNMACLTPNNDDDGDNTCRVYRPNHKTSSQILINGHGLKSDEAYFVVLVTPQDPHSFVAISSIIQWTKPRTPAPLSPVHGSLNAPRRSTTADVPESPLSDSRPAHDHLSEFSSDNEGTSPGIDIDSDNPTPPPPPSPAPSSPVSIRLNSNVSPLSLRSNRYIPATPAITSAAAVSSSPAVAQNPHPTSFTLGPRLETLDIFKVDRERWYEAKNDDNIQAVIGIFLGEKTLLDESRKRRRVEEV